MIKDVQQTVEVIMDGIKQSTDIVTIGMSGGADSTLVSTLCVMALGAENVYGVHMPYGVIDKEKFNANSKRIADKLGVKQITYDIGNAMDAFADEMEDALHPIDGKVAKLSDLNEGNARSRMRMISLYTINQHISERVNKRCRVMGTGNLSEDFIGYDTKGGDALADLFPIGELFKSEVYQLLDYFVSIGKLDADMIDRTPSAGLWDGQTDEEELGYTYNEMEPAIRFCQANYDIMPQVDKTEILKFVWDRHIANKHKHEGPAVVELGDFRE